MPKKRPVFDFSPAECVPFRDRSVIERVRRIKKEQLTRHPNPDFKIRIVKDSQIESMWLNDLFQRIKAAAEAEERLVMIMPNPWPAYSRLAAMINKHRVNCRRLYTFNMDEYANERGEIAPETWEFGFL